MNVETPRRRLTSAVAPAVAAAGLAGLGALLLVMSNGAGVPAPTAPRNCILENADAMGGPITLVDGNGARVTQSDFAGQPALVYFGFTHCPDVCPNTMYMVAEAQALGAPDAQPVLITLDPERDTPQVMEAYSHTDGFPAGLVGLTGSRAEVDAAKAAFRVYSQRAPIAGAPADSYNVDHSSFLYVMDGQWRTRAIYNTLGGNPADLAQCVAAGLGGR